MSTLLSIKGVIKKFIGKNDVFILPIIKFLLTYIALGKISANIGFMTKLSAKPITLVVALAGSFLPVNLTIFILGVIITAHVYALSLTAAIVVFAVFVILFLVYFRFASKDAYAAIITPVAFCLRLPYVVPVSMGLVGSPLSMVSVGFGVIVHNIIKFIGNNADSLRTPEGETVSIEVFKNTIDAILGNKDMFVYTLAFAITVLVVYLIRRLPVKYCWYIAIGAGIVTMLIGVGIGNSVFHGNVSMGATFGGMIVSALVNVVLTYFLFDLDYQRVEHVQYEDDEYYYYVKAVPKNEVVTYEEKQEKKKASASRSAAARRKAAVMKKNESTSKRPVRRPAMPPRRPAPGQAQRRVSQAGRDRRIEAISQDELKDMEEL